MRKTRDAIAAVNSCGAEQVAIRQPAKAGVERDSDACRAGVERLQKDARASERLVALGQQGMASGIDEAFDIDTFVADALAGQ